MKKVIGDSRVNMPRCRHKELLEMPTDACQLFYECPPIQLQLMGKTTESSYCG